MIHLTKKALGYLHNGAAGVSKAPLGKFACGAEREYDAEFCTVADVRAMVKGWAFAYYRTRVRDEAFRNPIKYPNCKTCQVLLDEALETTTQGNPP